MPIALPNLYCTPQDIYDQIGIEAAQLRLDDQNQASGQNVQATADAIIGATSIAVSALQYGLLRGTRLVFSDAQMDAPVEVTMSAVANVGATSIIVVALTTQVNANAIAIDNGVNVWLAGLLHKACQIGTAKVKRYCVPRYDDTSLVNSWSVNQWTVACAIQWLGTRLFRASPEPAQNAYNEAIEELKLVLSGQMPIEDIGTRTSEWPFLSNVTIDQTFTYRKVRVEQTISEPTPTQYAQAVDYNSYFTLEW